MNMKIPGGAYQLEDGRWVNANGKPIRPPTEGEIYEPREVISSPIVQRQPGEGQELAVGGSQDEYGKPEDMVTEETERTTRKASTKKKS